MSKFNYSIYYKMPAEWDRQISTWVSWPHNKNDWPDKFDKIPKVFVEIVYYLSIDQKVNIIFKTIQQKLNAFNHLKIRNANMKNISFFIFKTNRVWIRDYGPIFVKDKQGKKVIINWKFNAWSKYRDFKSDNKINYLIAKKTKKIIVIPKHNKKTVVLEGGALDVNGEGILITTKECLLSKVQQRNPGFTISDYEKIFAKYLGVKKVIWLEKGIKGDDTHGHIDDVAKFVSKNKIFINDTKNKKDVNYKNIKKNLKILQKEKNLDNKKFEIIKIPLPNPKFFRGTRVPASYMNFYITNKKVLVPTFRDVKDKVILKIFKKHFKNKKIIPIDCSDLIWGFGAIHCMTIQEPQ